MSTSSISGSSWSTSWRPPSAAIIGISSIHLLKTFINADNYAEKTLLWQTLIHVAFLASAMAIAATDRILGGPAKH